MLQLNPSFRPTADELLRHKIFDKIRVEEHEKPSPFKIDLPIYNEGQYDYDKCESLELTKKDFI